MSADLVNPNLTDRGKARRHLIQRQVLEAITNKGLDAVRFRDFRCTVGSFYHAYPDVEAAIEDALENGNTSQPTSPTELRDALDADRDYWWAVIQGEHGRTMRQVAASTALNGRLANWPLTHYQRAVLVSWLQIAPPKADPAVLAALLDALAPSKKRKAA